MANGSVVVVRVLGNTRGLTRSLKRAQDSLGGLQRISSAITGGMKLAAVATAIFAASAVAAGAVGAAALAAVPAAILGIGIAVAAQNAKVKKAFSGMASHVSGVMKRITKPLVDPLVRGADAIRAAFDTLAPSLERMFAASAPLLDKLFAQLQPIAKQLGPALESAFKAGAPVLLEFVKGLVPVTKGLRGFFDALAANGGAFTEFARTLMASVGDLLPALGRLLASLAPIGVTILQTIIPALISLLDWISGKVGPAFEAVTGFFARHETAAKAVGIALLALVGVVKAVQVAMALASAATLVFQGVATAVRVAIIVWKNAQLALNLALMANPIGLVIAAIVALVAVFVIAWKKSETFRKIVTGAWEAIKSATRAVWEWVKEKISAVVGFLVRIFTNFTVPGLLIKHWDKIKSTAAAAWSWVKEKISGFVSGIVETITSKISGVREWISGAWGKVKDLTREAWAALKSIIGDKISGFMDTIRGIKDRVQGALSNAGSWLLSAGRDLIRGLISGVGDMAWRLASKVGDVVGGAISKAKSMLGIFSPSRVFKGFGRYVGLGLIAGIKGTASKVAGAGGDLARNVADGFSAPRLTLDARPALSGPRGGGNTYHLTVQAPVGSSSTEIGRTLVQHIESFEKSGGRRRA